MDASTGSAPLSTIRTAEGSRGSSQRRSARVAYAVLVAMLAFVWQFVLFKPHGLIVVLFLMSWSVPLWNRAWPQRRFDWRQAA